MNSLQSIGVLLLSVVIVQGQFKAPTGKLGCSDPSVQAGHGYFAHETYCEKYYQCDSGLNVFERTCSPGTVYSASINVCVRPEQASCSVWESVSKQIGNRFPSLCCDQFYEYTGSGYLLKNCSSVSTSSNVVFNAENGQCVPGTCNDQPSCYRPGRGSATSAPGYTCFDKPDVSDPCVYTTEFAGNRIPKRPCPYGTAFNEILCQCSIVTSACPSNTANYTANKNLDPACQYSFNMDFDSVPLVATSQKLALGLTPLNYYIQSVGVGVLNTGVTNNGVPTNVGTFRGDPLNPSAYVYIYAYAANQLATPVVLSTTFKCENFNIFQFTLLTNAYNYQVCPPTIEVNVTCSASRYTVQVTAVGATATGVSTEIRNTGTATGSLEVSNTNSMVTVDIGFDGALKGKITEVNSGKTAAITSTNGRIGAYLATNKCGFVLARGLIGQVDRFTVREGCGDVSKYAQ